MSNIEKIAMAIRQHEKEQEILYLRKKRDFLQKHGMKSLPTRKTRTSLEEVWKY